MRAWGIADVRPHTRACIVLVSAAALPMFAAASEPASLPAAERFRMGSDIRPQTRSDDGRFALTATARVVPAATSRDGRFVLKAVDVPDVGCAPFPADGLFADGFEAVP